MDDKLTSLVLSTADWDRPLWTNKQYVARELTPLGPVLYMNSLGLRRPEMTPDDIRRVARRMMPRQVKQKQQSSGSEKLDRIVVRNPHIVPWHRKRFPIWNVNRLALRQATRSWHQASGRRVLWTFSPVTYDLSRFADFTIYHCVDLLEHFAGVDHIAVREGERMLAELPGVQAIASSRTVRDHLIERGFSNVLLWQNVADVAVIERRARATARRESNVIFAGNLTINKVDFELLRQVVCADGSVQLHLAGPVADGGGGRPNLRWLKDHPRVHMHGSLSRTELADLLGRCVVGLVPYRVTPYTRGVFPLKVYEYCAAGLAVVSTGLPSLADVDGVVRSESAEQFVETVRANLKLPTAALVDQRIRLARKHSWAERGRQIRSLIMDGTAEARPLAGA